MRESMDFPLVGAGRLTVAYLGSVLGAALGAVRAGSGPVSLFLLALPLLEDAFEELLLELLLAWESL